MHVKNFKEEFLKMAVLLRTLKQENSSIKLAVF